MRTKIDNANLRIYYLDTEESFDRWLPIGYIEPAEMDSDIDFRFEFPQE